MQYFVLVCIDADDNGEKKVFFFWFSASIIRNANAAAQQNKGTLCDCVLVGRFQYVNLFHVVYGFMHSPQSHDNIDTTVSQPSLGCIFF